MLKPAFALPSPLAAVARIDECDSVGSMSSGTGVGGEDSTFRLPEGVQLSSVCPTATSCGGEADAFDLGGGLDVEGCIVLEEESMLPCIEQVVTRLGEVVIIR